MSQLARLEPRRSWFERSMSVMSAFMF
jgi:hypothetical protein